MDETLGKVIGATSDFLERLTKSGSLDGDLLTEAHMATTALRYQLARLTYDHARLGQVRSEEQTLGRELRAHCERRRPPLPRQWKAGWCSGVGAELVAVIEESGADLANHRPAIEGLRKFLVSYYEPMDPMVGVGTRSAYQGGRGDSVRQDGKDDKGSSSITAPALERYLRRRFPGGQTTVARVERLTGGYSKETYLVHLDAESHDRMFVIRKDGTGLPTGSSVTDEFEVLKEARSLGVPAPEPLWLEQDATLFGTAFMAVAHVSARTANQIVPVDAESRVAWVDDLARVVALLHGKTLRRDVDVRQVLRNDIADLRRRVLERERQPHPGLSVGLAWLEAHLADLTDRPASRVHGDVGFHNILMRENRITALLDWEFSHISDPVEDLAMIRPFLEQIDGWPRFLAAYERQSGLEWDAVGAHYFLVWTQVRNLVACIGSLNSLLLPAVRDTALSVAGTIYIPKFEIAVLDAILRGEA